MDKRSLRITFESDQYEHLKELAKKNSLTLSALIRIAVIEYAKKLES